MRKNFTPDREDRIKLYEIREDIEAALTPAPDEDFNPELLAELDLKFDEKAAGCVAFLKNLKAHRDAVKIERKRLEAKEKTAASDIESLTAYLLSNMQQAERTKAGTGQHSARIQKNSQLTVIVMDENIVPDRFVEIKTEVKKGEIGRWHKETGEIIAGVDIVEGHHLRTS